MEAVVGDEQRLVYEVAGDGPPVVMITNVLSPPDWFLRPYRASLVDAGFRVLSVQHVGSSSSSRDVARDICEFVERFVQRPAFVWGYSQGGVIAQEMALLRPELVRGLVLMATSGRNSAFYEIASQASVELEGRAEELPFASLLMTLIWSLPPDATHYCNDELVEGIVRRVDEQALREASDDRARASLRASAITLSRSSDLAAVSAIEIPTLVISFEQDAAMMAPLGRELAGAIAGSQYIEVEGAGHYGAFTHSEAVSSAVLRFLSAWQ